MLKIVYRISDVGHSKVKAPYISNENCLKNATKVFLPEIYQWNVVADSVSDETRIMIEKYVKTDYIEHVKIKNGPGYPFMHMLDRMIKESNDSDVIYFVENDYIHRVGANVALLEGISLGADYVTLYDHPDKYKDPNNGGNPYCEGGAEDTRVYLSKSCHWKLTNSTTGTFAGTVESFKRDYDIIKQYANNNHWSDFYMWLALREKGISLISPIPGYSTHGDVGTITPLINWETEI